MTHPFPESMDYAGFNAPSRIECDIYDLVVEGDIPAEINGNWYRMTPDPQYPPRLGDDTFLSGDGMMSVFRFADGHVDFSSRYVMTERLINDRKARRSLYGAYRNPYTDDERVRGKGRGAANTTPVLHGGKLFALKEDSRAMALDPGTLETLGEWDFGGVLRSATMTAHTRLDPDTGELYFFGYEAGGLCTRDVAYCVAGADGELIREDWFEVPYCALMHDFIMTKEHAVFPVFPTIAELDRIKAGGPHWAWDPAQDTFIGIMPRDGSTDDMRWFRGPPAMSFHLMNGFTEGSKVHVDLSYARVNQFPFIREATGVQMTPEDLQIPYVRWTFDMSKPGEGWEEHPLGVGGDLPITAKKDQMKPYEIGYYGVYLPDFGPPLSTGPIGLGFNGLSRIEVNQGRQTFFGLGPGTTFSEPVHIPSNQPGHEGYLASVLDRHEEWLSEVVLLHAGDIAAGPIARIKLPMRLRNQVHGNWYPAG